MNDKNGTVSCAAGCWMVAALGGVLAAVLLGLLGSWTFLQAVFAGIVVAAAAGVLLNWVMCRPLPPLGQAKPMTKPETLPETAKPAASATSDAKVAKEAKATDDAKDAKADEDAKAAKAKADKKAADDAKKAEKAKEAEKAKAAEKAKKADEAKKAAAAKTAKPAPAPKTAKAPADDSSASQDGTKPATLKAARAGGPDDLKQIKGVGPKMEAMLHDMGIYHFDQVASWGPAEVAWVDENLKGFKGRATRDEWVSQAKTLAEGGSTAFSSKVKKGDVY